MRSSATGAPNSRTLRTVPPQPDPNAPTAFELIRRIAIDVDDHLPRRSEAVFTPLFGDRRGETNRIAPYIAPSLVRFPSLDQSSAPQREEIFGPEAALYAVDDLDEAIAAVNDSDYGLAASVMSADRSVYELADLVG